MQHRDKSSFKFKWIQFPLLSVAIVVSLFLAIQFWAQTTRKVEDLGVSVMDNVIWTLTQLEVEYLRLQFSLSELSHDEDPSAEKIAMARKHFDIYYSRVETLRESPLYHQALEQMNSLQALAVLHNDNASFVMYVDGPDAMFVSEAPKMLAVLQSHEAEVRKVATRGNLEVAKQGDAVRDEVRAFMKRLSVVALVLLACLAALVVLLYRLNLMNRKRVYERTRENSRFSAVISTSPDALIVTDGNGRIVEFNNVAQELLKVPRHRAIGRRFNRYLETDDGEVAALPFVETGRVSGVELQLCAADQSRVPVGVSQGVALIEQERLFVYFLRDISDRKASEVALRASRDRALAGDRAKSRFLAVMSHEMRTPLNGILGLVQLMRDGRQRSKDMNRYLDMLENSGQILLDHVNDVLDIAQLEAEGVQLSERPFDMDRLLQEVVEPLQVSAEANHNTLTLIKAPQELGWFNGDATRLRQIMMNLIGNAIKFTDNGEISVSLSLHGEGQIVEFELQVSDTGIGVAEELQDRIFEDFVRVENLNEQKKEGTGLGLGIAKRIVTAMGGTIGVDSIPDEGSVFWIHLSLTRCCSVPELAEIPGMGPHDVTPLSVLIVEDNQTNRFVLREMLERDGHSVVEAVNGLEGVKVASETRFDMILMDINMPVMGGLEATRQIRRAGANRDTRILALTAHVVDRDGATYREAGIDAVLSKPIMRQDLRRVVQGQDVIALPASAEAMILEEDHLSQVLSTLKTQRGQDLLAQFLVDGPKLINMLPSHGSQPGEDEGQLATLVHNLAGTSAMVGARKLRNTLNALEKQILAKDVTGLEIWAETLCKVWEETAQAVENHQKPNP